MAKKENHDGITRYYCEKCGNEMFAFFNKTKRFTEESKVLFKEYLNYININGPYYTCQYCGTIHRINYSGNGKLLDFDSFNKNQYENDLK